MRLRRRTPIHLAALLLICVGAARPAEARRGGGTAGRQGSDELVERTRRFARAVLDGPRDSLLAFLPQTGDFTWVHTYHLRTGNQVRVWRFPAAEARRALVGPLTDVLEDNVHRQPIGAFAHQVKLRGPGPGGVGEPVRWRRVRGNRMVPANEPASSPFFVEWRREGGEWVVSAFGDESFGEGVPFPRWCC